MNWISVQGILHKGEERVKHRVILLEIQLLNMFQALPCKRRLQKNRFGQQCISVQESAIQGVNEFLISIQQLREAVFPPVPTVVHFTELAQCGPIRPIRRLRKRCLSEKCGEPLR